MEKRNYQVQLLGTSFTVQTDEEPEYFEGLLTYIKSKTDEIEASVGVKDPLKTAILTCLTIADELHKGDDTGEDPAEVERITLSIIDRIDKSLGIQ